jgi:hypothetical protein
VFVHTQLARLEKHALFENVMAGWVDARRQTWLAAVDGMHLAQTQTRLTLWFFALDGRALHVGVVKGQTRVGIKPVCTQHAVGLGHGIEKMKIVSSRKKVGKKRGKKKDGA